MSDEGQGGSIPPDPGTATRNEDPYEDVDVSSLPEWWQEAIREFEEHDLRPFQPPRFADGLPLFEVIEDLEEKHGVVIDFIGINVSHGDDWTVRIDADPVGTIGRRRTAQAFTEFEMTAQGFIDWIEDCI